MNTCKYDTGSMYGCEPACSKPAAYAFTYWTYGGPFTAHLCYGHLGPMGARVWPAKHETRAL